VKCYVGAGGDIAYMRAQLVLGDLLQVPLTPELLDAAGSLPGPLHSPGAIHLATALRLRGDLEWLVAYDERLIKAADQMGLRTASPR
jgi:uncharacterized protein